MFGNFFKSRSYYVFDYKPRYYNERKERREALEKKIQEENNPEIDENLKIRLTKNNLRKDWVHAKKSSSDRNTNLRLAIIITILVAIVAYIFQLHTLF